jgi:hypothetical protein
MEKSIEQIKESLIKFDSLRFDFEKTKQEFKTGYFPPNSPQILVLRQKLQSILDNLREFQKSLPSQRANLETEKQEQHCIHLQEDS